ncbi:efflux RND transporter periplasmic adaptor subunit [Cesiribacter andamanensis]|uniref:Macrolide-specific efflux protein macA n=1 Tax=Cesiribacter andamanensis AMV16 TaxID=1279009 RepID=M7MXE9_9BACT|nr:efflux RND transporter periplasmic adaptor subunit [Cesiribacter andamanensis]EMR01118.1 Macrolide-specific efflux protein macA precursor [Cesiribacter andamanensis AMV16]
MAVKKKKSNRTLYSIVGILLLLIIVAVVAKSAGWIGAPKGTEVELAEAQRRTITEKVSASGMIQPETEVKLSPDVPGEITELYVNEGDSVKPGQLLLKIRPDNFQSALSRTQANYNERRANVASSQSRLAQAESQLERARNEWERNQKLHKQGVISDAEWEQAQLNYTVAQQDLESARQGVQAARYQMESASATVREAQENLRLTSVFAPMGGIVSKLDVEKGERVVGTSQMAGTEMLRIADLNRMEVQVDVNENDIIRVSRGDTVIIDVDAYAFQNKKFSGVVTSIANTANTKVSPDAVTEFKVKIRILQSSYEDLVKEGKSYPFRPGMTASVEIITNKKEGVLAVPLAAVTTRDNVADNPKEAGGSDPANDNPRTVPKPSGPVQEVVFLVKEGKAQKAQVKTGISDYEFIEITEGLEAGQQVVSGPYVIVTKRLRDGEQVRAAEKKEKDSKLAGND